MSVISYPETTPNRVAILYRFLDAQSTPMQQEVLFSLVSPPSLQKKEEDDSELNRMAKRVLNESLALGLVERTAEEGGLQVPDHLRGLDQEGLRALLERRLTHLDEAAATGQEQMPHALAWFLNQPAASPLAFRDNQKEEIMAETEGRHLDLTNTIRFQQFSYWVQYLGLGWHLRGSAGLELVSDPTAALAMHLRAILSSMREAPIRKVMEGLAERLPIMELGAVRKDVEEWLPADKRRGLNDLSQSTSLALLRLQRRGLIGLDQRSDAPVMRLLTWPETRPVSHVVWKQT